MLVSLVVFRRKQEFWFLHKVSILLLLNPHLHYQLPIWSLAPKRRQIVHEIWKSRWRRVIFGSILVWGREGRLQTGCLFISALIDQERCLSCHRARDIQPSRLTSQSGKQVSLFGFSFQLETTLQHIFSTKCPFQRKTCQIHANQSLMLLKTAVASKRLNLMNSKTGFGKLKNGTKTELDEISSINCAENAAKCQKLC